MIPLLFITIPICYAQKQKLSDFIPAGYTLSEKYHGDLNKDGEIDCVIIIKKTDKKNVVVGQYGNKKVDKNRRGIIILFKKGDTYQLSDYNYDCFSSEHEDGGVYHPPELLIKIRGDLLVFEYLHGRYGRWEYRFKYQKSNFELIGYDRSDGGVVIDREVYIDFVKREKLNIENTNIDAQGGDEIFKKTRSKVNSKKLMKLSEIKDFDDLYFK